MKDWVGEGREPKILYKVTRERNGGGGCGGPDIEIKDHVGGSFRKRDLLKEVEMGGCSGSGVKGDEGSRFH